VPTFADIAVKAQQKTYLLRDSAREAQDDLKQKEAAAREQIQKELPLKLHDLGRYVAHVEKLYRTLDRGELKSILLLLSGAGKAQIFSTNFAIGFFRGAGAMLGVALVMAVILLIAFNSPYQKEILYALSKIF
jgi:hypothetical protein